MATKMIQCSDKESVFQAVKRVMGNGYKVDLDENADNKMRSSDKRKPKPAATVRVRQGEAFFVYKQ